MIAATRIPGRDEPYREPQYWHRNRHITAATAAQERADIPLRLTPAEEAELAHYQGLRAAGVWPPLPAPRAAGRTPLSREV